MVEYLEFFGKKWPVRIGYYVMKKIKEETGKGFSEAMEEANKNDEIELFEVILWYALEMGARADNKKEQFEELSREDMEVALDLCFADFLKMISSDTFFPKELKDQVPAEQQQAVGNGQPSQPKKKRKKKAQK